jgi:hypothetical protein
LLIVLVILPLMIVLVSCHWNSFAPFRVDLIPESQFERQQEVLAFVQPYGFLLETVDLRPVRVDRLLVEIIVAPPALPSPVSVEVRSDELSLHSGITIHHRRRRFH